MKKILFLTPIFSLSLLAFSDTAQAKVMSESAEAETLPMIPADMKDTEISTEGSKHDVMTIEKNEAADGNDKNVSDKMSHKLDDMAKLKHILKKADQKIKASMHKESMHTSVEPKEADEAAK